MRSQIRPSASGSFQPATGGSGSAARCIALAGAIAGLAAAAPASALFDDKVEIWAAENLTHDTNVFRISDELDPATVGATQRYDTIYTTHLGITAGVPISLQRVEAAYTWYTARYRFYKDLDYDGHTARAAWNWVYGHANGLAEYTESVGLSSFSNIQARLKDLITARQGQLTGEWLATPRWKWNGRMFAASSDHSNEVRSINDIEEAGVEVGGAYVTPLDNTVGATVRYQRGRSPHGSPFSAVPGVPLVFDNEYDQVGGGATIAWNLTGHSRFDGRLEYVRRDYKQLTSRNYEGPAFRALYTWTPTGKLKVTAAGFREIGPAQDIQSSLVIVTGGYIRPLWNVTDKVILQANAEYNVWDYHGDPITGQGFTHRQRLFGASVQWKPYQRVFLQAGINREVRTSTLVFGDYDVNVGFIEGRIGF